MDSVFLHRKLVIERCQLYVAQMQAVHHLGQEGDDGFLPETESVQKLLGHLVQDLTFLEEALTQDT